MGRLRGIGRTSGGRLRPAVRTRLERAPVFGRARPWGYARVRVARHPRHRLRQRGGQRNVDDADRSGYVVALLYSAIVARPMMSLDFCSFRAAVDSASTIDSKTAMSWRSSVSIPIE
jgi:hypothetical protein